MDMSEMDDAMSAAGDASDEKRGREKLLRSMMLQQMMGGAGNSQFAPFLGAMQGMMGGMMQSRDPFGGLQMLGKRNPRNPVLGPDDPTGGMMGGYT